MISRSIYNLKFDKIYMYHIPFDRSFLQLSNGIRHVMPSTDRKLELTAKASMAQPVSQQALCCNGLRDSRLKQTVLTTAGYRVCLQVYPNLTFIVIIPRKFSLLFLYWIHSLTQCGCKQFKYILLVLLHCHWYREWAGVREGTQIWEGGFKN